MSYAHELSRRLAAQAEAVCRAYLPAGRRSGRYWIAGDAQGARGKSLFVALKGERAGRWQDAASGEYGDLLDLIGLNQGFYHLRDTLAEARHFLREPIRIRADTPASHQRSHDRVAAAKRLHRLSYRCAKRMTPVALLRFRGGPDHDSLWS